MGWTLQGEEQQVHRVLCLSVSCRKACLPCRRASWTYCASVQFLQSVVVNPPGTPSRSPHTCLPSQCSPSPASKCFCFWWPIPEACLHHTALWLPEWLCHNHQEQTEHNWQVKVSHCSNRLPLANDKQLWEYESPPVLPLCRTDVRSNIDPGFPVGPGWTYTSPVFVWHHILARLHLLYLVSLTPLHASPGGLL